ncbi:MAG: nucleotidyl transferase AbiEii/AbiGii toxin family protein, partial [Proteiniphilum sp.]
YQRRKGRDLFDLYKGLNTAEVNTEHLIRCYHRYMDFVIDNPPTKKEFLLNMEQKIVDDEFLGDTSMLLRPEENFNPEEAYDLVREKLIERL